MNVKNFISLLRRGNITARLWGGGVAFDLLSRLNKRNVFRARPMMKIISKRYKGREPIRTYSFLFDFCSIFDRLLFEIERAKKYTCTNIAVSTAEHFSVGAHAFVPEIIIFHRSISVATTQIITFRIV